VFGFTLKIRWRQDGQQTLKTLLDSTPWRSLTKELKLVDYVSGSLQYELLAIRIFQLNFTHEY